MAAILRSKLDEALKRRLEHIDLASLCRVSMSRIAQTAVPKIGFIELVTGDTFQAVYNDLYVASFPKRAERERSNLIVDRLRKEFAHERAGLAPYRVVGIRDAHGAAIAAAQFSVLLLPTNDWAVPYLQYIYVRPQSRRQDMSEVLYMMILAVSTVDASADGRAVPFVVFETDPPGHGDDSASQAYAHERVRIHAKGGSVAMMLRRQHDGAIISPHVQPGLEDGEPPVTVVWVIKQLPQPGRPYDIRKIGGQLIAAYYRSLRDEGFPDANIQLAEQLVGQRARDADFVLMPLDRVRSAHANDYLLPCGEEEEEEAE